MTSALAQVASTGLAPQQYLTLLELSRAISIHRNLPDLFHDLAGRLHDLYEFRNLGVVLYDKSRDVLRLHILASTEPAIRAIPDELPINGSLSGWVWQNQQPLITADIQKETRFTTPALVKDYPVKAVCVLPLTTAHGRLGVFNIWSEKAGAYDDLDLDFAELVTSQIAVAVENALNFQEVQSAHQQLTKERDQLRLLLDVGNAVVSTLDLRELLVTISECLRSVIPHCIAILALYDSDNKTLQIQALDFNSKTGFLREGLSVRVEDAPSGLALMKRETLLMTRADIAKIDS